MKIVIGLFNPGDMIEAISSLREYGVTYDDMSVISSASDMPEFLESDSEKAAVSGAAAGAAAGGVLGALGAWISPNIPGFESMFAAGLLTTTAGSVIGGYLGSLYSMRADDQTELDIDQELEAGHVLLLVRVNDSRVNDSIDEKTASLLKDSGGRDVEIHEI
jgi:outer membrane lipoprotein SlyB